MELEIRRAQPDDAEAIVAYLNRIGGESDNLLFGENEFRMTAEQERKYIENLNQSEASVMLLGLAGDVIVSVAMVTAPGRPRVRHTSELSISVRKDHWDQGIGKRMMQGLIAFARGNGITRLIELSVRTDNHAAVRLYRSVGFEDVGIVRGSTCVDGQYFDTLKMCLYL